jgi:hypothetical protein
MTNPPSNRTDAEIRRNALALASADTHSADEIKRKLLALMNADPAVRDAFTVPFWRPEQIADREFSEFQRGLYSDLNAPRKTIKPLKMTDKPPESGDL